MKKKQTVREERFDSKREYKFDLAMLETVKRSASHPRPISMGTKVPENVKY